MFELLENRYGEMSQIGIVESESGLDVFLMSDFPGFDDETEEARRLVRCSGVIVLLFWGAGNRNLMKWRVLTKRGIRQFARERLGNVDIARLRSAPSRRGTSLAEILAFPQYNFPVRPRHLIKMPERDVNGEFAPEAFFATAETRFAFAHGSPSMEWMRR